MTMQSQAFLDNKIFPPNTINFSINIKLNFSCMFLFYYFFVIFGSGEGQLLGLIFFAQNDSFLISVLSWFSSLLDSLPEHFRSLKLKLSALNSVKRGLAVLTKTIWISRSISIKKKYSDVANLKSVVFRQSYTIFNEFSI